MTSLDAGDGLSLADIDRVKELQYESNRTIRHVHRDIRDQVFDVQCLGESLPKVDLTSQSDIDKVARIAKPNDLFQANLKVNHYFSDGVYARELIIPKDTVIVGKIHKHQNLNMLVKGELDVLVDGVIKRLTAPFTIVSPPGTKRIAHAIEDSVWITIHRTDEVDLEKIEQHFIAQSETEWLEFCKNEPQLPMFDENGLLYSCKHISTDT